MKKLLTAALALVLVFSLVACGKENSGTTGDKTVLTGSEQGFAGPIEVTVTKEGDKITNIEVKDNKETPEYGGEAIKELSAKILENGTVEGVDVVSGSTVTSEAFLKAVKEAK